MPFFETTTSVKLDDAAKASLYEGYKKVCSGPVGKPEQFLMVSFKDGAYMAFQGTRDPCVYVEVKLYGKITKDAGNKATEQITALLTQICSVPSSKIFVTFFETEHWGWDGRIF